MEEEEEDDDKEDKEEEDEGDDKREDEEGEEPEEERPGNHPYINIQLIQHSREVRRDPEYAAEFWRLSEKQSVRLLSVLSATAASWIIPDLFVFTRGMKMWLREPTDSSGTAPGSRRGPDKRINADYRRKGCVT